MAKNLTKQEFLKRLNNNQLVLTLIGMSNIGKSHWSKKLGEIGFKHISCDGRIENKLRQHSVEIRNNGTAGLAEWIGYPYEKRFKKTQAEYLSTEKEIMMEIIDELEQGVTENIAIDTSGSFIHTGKTTQEGIRKNSLIVYIKIPIEMKEEMYKKFIEHPKPIIWDKIYTKRKTENEIDALARCYPDLLDYRLKLYEECADISISYESIYNKVDAAGFLKLIKNQL